MKKLMLIFTISSMAFIQCYSQIVFESGYFISESGQRVDCFIKNSDWKNNPTGFDYRLSENSEILQQDIKNVKEFGIKDISKYIRSLVKIDRSGYNLENMSTGKSPVYKEELLFLKVMMEGKASLFLYEEGTLSRYFFKMNDSTIDQLVYKRYLVDDKTIGENNYFRQQLNLGLKCRNITADDFKYIDYSTSDLMRIFKKYNECENSGFVDYTIKSKRDVFNLTVRPGVNYSGLSIHNTSASNFIAEFDNEFNLRIGIETEFIIPFNKSKWAVLIEPTYQYFKSEIATETTNISGGIVVTNVDYKSIELPVGIRYDFFLKDKSTIFLNGSYIIDFSFNSLITYSRADGSRINSVDINTGNNLAFGAGYTHKGRYNLEIRYQTNRDILSKNLFYVTKYQTFSLILGYTLF
jgi:hypothetical protein